MNPYNCEDSSMMELGIQELLTMNDLDNVKIYHSNIPLRRYRLIYYSLFDFEAKKCIFTVLGFFHTYSLPAIVQAFILPQGGVRLMIHQSHGRNAANQGVTFG